ncbi:hypothetical protein [Hyphomicrobium sp. CS1GBMeth3]|uniref:hypothetical protein n=1 Tax=Hyphomicrobium sp. CS1GBMeth3 TaxID=1892845 RepID=UPI0009310FCA|nr:hypothetical protein [Hyphomicrobium sp. CS1GBMeth3]
MRFTETEINAKIAPRSVRWPAAETNPVWSALHRVVAVAKEQVIAADKFISERETDPDLSDSARIRKIGEDAKLYIDLLIVNDLPELQSATAAVERFFDNIAKGTFAKERKPGPYTSDDALAAEIRAHVASQKGKTGQTDAPYQFAFKHRSDPRVFEAITGAPAFLSGLTDEQMTTFAGSAAEALWPDEIQAKRELKKALAEAGQAVKAAERMIFERSNGCLLKTGSGYQVKQIGSGAPTKNSFRPNPMRDPAVAEERRRVANS